jgi:hypothetical protein
MFSSNASAVSDDANYIESCFSTWLYTGTGATQTITNGIDLAGKGGLVWTKNRTGDPSGHALIDTARGIGRILNSNNTGAQSSVTTDTTAALTAFNATGYTLGSDSGNWGTNFNSSYTYVSWTFRKQPKFFDVVTYTGNGSSITVNHNLGSVPGMIIIKNLSQSDSWLVWHRSMSGFAPYMFLNETLAVQNNGGISSVSSTSFTYPWSFSTGNGNGLQYIAYVFAHNAGGFGLTGSDNVISCGSYTGTGSAGNNINLGYEPQWLMIKRIDASGPNWLMFDTMRGWVNDPIIANGGDKFLYANTDREEGDYYNNLGGDDFGNPTATGFVLNSAAGSTNGSGGTYIYIAIRRGPMKVPTTGTSVLNLSARTGNANAGAGIGAGFTDLIITKDTAGSEIWAWTDRLRGRIRELNSSTATAETSYSNDVTGFDRMDGVNLGTGSGGQVNSSGTTYINYLMRRAPGVFDEVCYTGNSTLGATQSHNLRVAPELIIVKVLNTGANWAVYSQTLGATKYLMLNQTSASTTSSVFWNDTAPTSSVFTLGNVEAVNTSGRPYVAYLFASCPGVSKVGNYTGNGSSQTINCGFTGGARFVMIKRTDDTGDWYVWDTARGIVSGNDPHLSLNTTAAEVTSNDTIDTDSTGFVVNQVSATNVNVSSATYIFMAVA